MSPRPLTSLPLLLTCCLCAVPPSAAGRTFLLAAQDAEAAPPAKAEAQTDESPADWRDDLVLSEHELVIDGETLHYSASAGTMLMETESGEDLAHIFFVAYELDDVEDVSRRPITFCFNGGPGSSSVWLHLGAFGPRRVPMNDDATVNAPPYQLVDNPDTLLDVSDLVFIDPVTTGYSRAAPGTDDDRFHGVSEDIRSVGDFIRLYTTRMQRWGSPKFLAGESYGTTRAAGLAGYLQQHHGMWLNGIVLISSILDFGGARFDPGNDLPYPLFLPSYCATAFYHQRLGPELQRDLAATLEQVETFALGQYWSALALGDALTGEHRERIAAQLARFTGLSVDYVQRSNLRINIQQFTKELRRDERLSVGRLDSRYSGRDADALGATPDRDPSYAAIQGPYTAALNDYVRGELGYESDLPYEILTGRVHPWNYGRDQGYVNEAPTLRDAMHQNPQLRVYVANGYYDLATPYFATRYTFRHMGLAPELAGNVSMGYFEAGHMMYIHSPSAARLKTEVAAFVRQASGD